MEAKRKEYLLLGSIWVASIIITWTIIFSWKELPDKNSNPITPNTEVSKENILTSSTISETITSTWDIDEDALRKEKKDTLVATDNKNAPEIIVDDEYIELMPTVEEKVEKKDIDKEKNKDELPAEINLNVPFYPQAPDANWALPWKDACEESSVVLAYHFVKGDTITKAQFKEDVLGLVDLQNEIFGDYIDTDIAQTAEMLEKFYDYKNYEIIDNPTIEDLKRELAQWHPIIAPFAWKKLWNSFFTNGGPRYHMLVIVWYNDSFFITNDVGTSRWKDFAYSYNVIMDSLHDLVPEWEWNIADWAKRVLVIK